MTDEEREEECNRFLDRWPNSEFGPAHIVVADSNFEPGHIEWCRGIVWAIQYARREQDGPIRLYENLSDAELEATDRLLAYLTNGEHPARISVKRPGALVVEPLRWMDIEPPNHQAG